jgi:Ca-activated chloride channel family protein
MFRRQTGFREGRHFRGGVSSSGHLGKWATAALLTAFLVAPATFTGATQDAAAPQAEPKSSTPAPAATAPANEPTETTEQKPIRVRVNEVNVPVTVLSKRGIPVIDLEQKEFRIFENGVGQKIKYFYRGERPPLRIGLVMDTSNSARPQLKFEQESAGEFVFNILQGRSNRNKIFLQTFDSSSSIVQDYTSDPDLLNEKIRKLKAGGGKALYDAIYSACKDKMLTLGPRAETRRVLVVISDGLDAQSEHTLDEAISMARRAETAIYAIGNVAWGYHNPGDKVLEDLAEQTGGEPFFPREETPGTDLQAGYLSHGQIGDTSQNKGLDAGTGTYSAQRLEAIADSLDAIQRQLNNQYNIGYTPTDSKMDGTYRTIKVECLRKGVEIRFKPGYFATPE